MENYFSAVNIIFNIFAEIVLHSVSRKSGKIHFLQIITLTINITVLTNNICMRNRNILVVFGFLEALGLLGFGEIFVPC